jgi:galactose mutarotase-like enzyme
LTRFPWHQKISNSGQLGGIETAVLDNGPGRGTRIAWINTGTGLRYKVVLDRAMDIADAFFNQHSLAWLSHSGITAPEPFSNHGLEWLRTFGGGLLTTCGLSHVGGPEHSATGELGLHGQISNIPAEIESIVQPDHLTGQMEMRITGRMKQTQVLGPSLELKRTITSTLGQAKITIQDEVINRGNKPAPHMLLYHCNFGWPLVDEGTEIVWSGSWESPGEVTATKIFQEGKNFKKCAAPLDAHAGTGEEVAFIQINPDADGNCTAGLHNPQLEIALALRFPKSQLPWLTNWQHWGKNEYVTGLEPGTHPPIGQTKAQEQNTLIYLEPGETRKYHLEMEVLTTPESIALFIQNNQA